MTRFSYFLTVLSCFFCVSFAPATQMEVAFDTINDCGANERIEHSDLPNYEQENWYETWDPWYSTHYTSHVSFSDGYAGKIFKGGVSKRFFIGDSDGGKYYYVSQKATIRALYLYKRYGCFSTKYRY